MEELKCNKCKEYKPSLEFSKNKNRKNGFQNKCKKCHSIYRKQKYIENIEKEKEQVRNYKKTYPEKSRGSNYSRKSGKVVESKCPVCENKVFLTKKESSNQYVRYCSKFCRSTTYKSNYHHYCMSVYKRSEKTLKDCDITEDYLKYLLEDVQKNKCALTGINIVLQRPGLPSILYYSASLDRKDTSKGYTKDNVQWVVLGVNYMKLDYTQEDTIKLLDLIKENYIGIAQSVEQGSPKSEALIR